MLCTGKTASCYFQQLFARWKKYRGGIKVFLSVLKRSCSAWGQSLGTKIRPSAASLLATCAV